MRQNINSCSLCYFAMFLYCFIIAVSLFCTPIFLLSCRNLRVERTEVVKPKTRKGRPQTSLESNTTDREKSNGSGNGEGNCMEQESKCQLHPLQNRKRQLISLAEQDMRQSGPWWQKMRQTFGNQARSPGVHEMSEEAR